MNLEQICNKYHITSVGYKSASTDNLKILEKNAIHKLEKEKGIFITGLTALLNHTVYIDDAVIEKTSIITKSHNNVFINVKFDDVVFKNSFINSNIFINCAFENCVFKSSRIKKTSFISCSFLETQCTDTEWSQLEFINTDPSQILTEDGYITDNDKNITVDMRKPEEIFSFLNPDNLTEIKKKESEEMNTNLNNLADKIKEKENYIGSASKPELQNYSYSDCTFRDMQFSKETIEYPTQIIRCSFTNVKFSNMNFANVCFDESEFRDCTFENCSFARCSLVKTEFSEECEVFCHFYRCNFFDAIFRCDEGFSEFKDTLLNIPGSFPDEKSKRAIDNTLSTSDDIVAQLSSIIQFLSSQKFKDSMKQPVKENDVEEYFSELDIMDQMSLISRLTTHSAIKRKESDNSSTPVYTSKKVI